MNPRDARSEDAARIRRWLQDVMRRTGKKVTPLAKDAGIAPSTLIRALDETNPTSLSRATIAAICARYGVAGPDEPNAPRQAGGFAEADIQALEQQPPTWCGVALGPNDYVATVTSRVLDVVGLMPGDEILLSMDASPESGDLAQAQVYAGAQAETVLRLYDAPYLVARTTLADAPKPLLVDGTMVRIAAVAQRVLRSLKGP